MIGKTISHYKILEKLGEGGMGVVYKAQDTKLRRIVALKFLPPQALGTEDEKTRFVHEAQAAAALTHPNICTVYEIDEADGQTFISMECVEGQNLKQKISSAPLKLEEALGVAVQIAEGLQEAHERGMVHRDIKSANIMLTPKGQVKVMDFGLAKLYGATKVTKTGTTVGTAAYMSPEQARGETVDHRSDIWSFGVVLYEMLTGQLPFKGDYGEAIIYSILNQSPEPITALRTGVPMELERIIGKALAKSPGERYQHVDEMLVDLRTLQKELESGRAMTPASRTEPRRRRRILWYGGGAVILILLVAAALRFFPRDRETIDSIAVLPLENLSGDPEQEYFVDGMTEALITELSKIGALRVISRTSVMRYKETDKPLAEIASELGVDAVVEGSVLRVGDRVRITAQLIGAVPERHLWAESYDRDVGDVLILSSEVAQTIAREIRVRLTQQEQERLASERPVDPEAYELYLKGQHRLYDGWSPKAAEEAIEYFRGAVQKEPDFAEAYAALADCYIWLGWSGALPLKEASSKATNFVERALDIDDSLSEAHYSLGGIKFYLEWDWQGGAEEYKRAMALNPNNAFAHGEYAWTLAARGRFEEAIVEAKRMFQLNPVAYAANMSMVWLHYLARQYDEALAYCSQWAELEPNDYRPYSDMTTVYAQMGRYEDAVRAQKRSMTLRGAPPERIAALDSAYSESGPKGYWKWRLERLGRLEGGYDRYPAYTAMYYGQLGEKDKAFAWLERAYEKHDAAMFRLKVDPPWDPLRDDPRFQDMLHRMNFPED
ncbi:MAG: protein kinase [Candidatus Eiseniibacteriota bacterium]|nr:MAG: protein kinase [Candidatus Eisenbacteria bacterium]